MLLIFYYFSSDYYSKIKEVFTANKRHHEPREIILRRTFSSFLLGGTGLSSRR